MLNVLRELTAAVENRQPVALATIVEAQGASPARPGFKLLVRPDGTWLGNVGGGELEACVRQAAQEALAASQPCTMHYSLRAEGPNAIGMLCGGEVTVFVEPYLPKPVLLIVGGAHIGRPLAEVELVRHGGSGQPRSIVLRSADGEAVAESAGQVETGGTR